MTDKKISALPAATTPLAGTEVLPIVQSGVTDKVSVADLTAGRAISATQYTSTIATGTAPLVVASTTEVANLKAARATSADGVKSNATTGILQVVGPSAGSTRTMTVPDANFTVAKTNAGQTFIGNQQFNGHILIGTSAITGATDNSNYVTGGIHSSVNGSGFSVPSNVATTMFTLASTGQSQTWIVCADLQGEGTVSFACVYIVTLIYNSVSQALPLVKGANASISVSGLDVKYTQTSGGTKTNTQFSAIRIM